VWPLASLQLSGDGHVALPLFLPHHSTTLTSLDINLSASENGTEFELISLFVNLQSLRVTIDHPYTLSPLTYYLKRLRHLTHLHLTVACMEDRAEIETNRAKAAPYGNYSLINLPLSLRYIDLRNAFLPFASILQLIGIIRKRKERKGCFLSWAEDDWSGVEMMIMQDTVGYQEGKRKCMVL
jgi:hypothetical protein